MRLGFIVHRGPQMKILGPLMAESLKQGHQVFVLNVVSLQTSEKLYQNITRAMLSQLLDKNFRLIPCQVDDIYTTGVEQRLDTLITVEGYYVAKNHKFLAQLKSLQATGTQIVSLGHFYETLLRPIKAIETFDKTFYLSPHARDLHYQLQVSSDDAVIVKERLSARYAVTGSPMFDFIGTYNKQEVRTRYGLPDDKATVLLIAPVISPTTPWRYHVWRDQSKLSRTLTAMKRNEYNHLNEIWSGQTYLKIVKAIRRFCNRNQATLIIKSRGKHEDPQYLLDAADVYLDGYEDVYYPRFTTHELLSVSDLCFTVMSMAALEAVAADVPTINIRVPHRDFDPLPDDMYLKYLDLVLGENTQGMLNFTGCISSIDRREFVTWLESKMLADLAFDQRKGQMYKHLFLGIDKVSSSQKILQELESPSINKKERLRT